MTEPRTNTTIDDAVAILRAAIPSTASSPLITAVADFLAAWDHLWPIEQALALMDTARRLTAMTCALRESANTLGGLDEARGHLAAIRDVVNGVLGEEPNGGR